MTKFEGYFTALVTPFSGGQIDEAAFRDLVEWQISEGARGLVPCGTTGESPTLTHKEHMRVVELCIDVVSGRVPIIAGAGSNATIEAKNLTRHAKEAGADGTLLVMPYYNKPTQEGMYRHYMTIADAVEIPQFIYNIPGRCVVDMSIETMARLSKHINIVGVKDATADLCRPTLVRRACGEDFIQFSGEDGTALGFLAQGGHGVISVTANITPRACMEFFEAWQSGDNFEAVKKHTALMPIHDILFIESSPIPVKFALSLMNRCTQEFRLPLCEPSKENSILLEEALRKSNILQ
ncbi:MAG: 4-hydroxy-tetrahydrodipicolinate synthase [Rhodospirillaceae bacterium]|nr:4-hydroxy-tetrahydrodipicolinate synthase [Alphaproteobacteria bacterium]MBR72157.1 4-hydroxy-tetrahydrodipicolinate synthase [Rhodospirillaceae bacterium]|tara:strand:- start:5266 stop:6147 length:882 start_codon:yes stop_codon:yes gene_type:complete